MSTMVKLLLAGCLVLVTPLILFRLSGGPAPETRPGAQAPAGSRSNDEAMQVFYREADMRNRFLNGFDRLQTARMLVGSYHHQNYELPTSFAQLGHDLSKAQGNGADAFEMDPDDSSVTMYFEGQKDIKDGAVTYSPTVDENNEKIAWECWTTDYPDIKKMIPMCKYYEPR